MADDNGDTQDTDQTRRIKVTAVGDSGVGKTSMLMTFATGSFPDSDVPALYEHSTIKAGRTTSFEVPVTLDVNNDTFELGLTDTIGKDEYRQFRELFATGTDVFLVCFSVTEPDSLENVKRKWLTEIRILTPKAPFILVGTKTDLREDSETLERLHAKHVKPTTIQAGIKLAKSFGARTYVECSAINRVGLKQVFDNVVLVVTQKKNTRKKDGQHELCRIS